MSCVLCQDPATKTLWNTEHLCNSCFQSYVNKEVVVYQAKHSSKRRALRPFPFSLEHDVVSFRRRSKSAPFDYHDPRLERRLPRQPGTPLSHSPHPPSPEVLLGANSPQTSQPLLFTPPPLQLPLPSSPLAMAASGNGGTNNDHSFVSDDDDGPWIQALAATKESFKARVDKLRAEIEALKAENNMLRQKLIDAKQILAQSKQLQSAMDALLN
ncbi:hypothetical protein BWQ96_10475 [Gracilariopsis chorda]|uniref:Uncharacterized protein n=1 Tax=Gracilariopsis chorda TaxID=448386 RepID=A0A2V3ICK6_9FLOR|nr:hypothetical protein BWQ96_10475 [Gracilariopsis chorda]|eukprot:PXF39819.1 hypothetical protein BWQ96_10475 [Gracilariopsis chorda]